MEDRHKIQNSWIKGETKNVVATNAFGMGIDKSDVKLVIHVDMPGSIEEYYQEAGRAGRDGAPASALVIYDDSNIIKARTDLKASYPEENEIKRVYRALSIYFDLAIGSGLNQSFPFDLKSFCNKYGLSLSTTFYALKELVRSGYIVMNEGVSMVSRIQMTMEKMDLYNFMLQNDSYEKILKIFLRSYEGVFSDPVKISEKYLSNSIGISENQLVKDLRKLSKMDVLEYKERSDKGSIVFLQERLTSDNLKIDHKSYALRKSRATKRLDGMINYLNDQSCRQEYICRYFDDHLETKCGICDLCIKDGNFAKMLDQIESLLKQQCAAGPISYKDFLHQWSLNERDEVIETLTFFESEEYIRVTEGNIHWLGKKEN